MAGVDVRAVDPGGPEATGLVADFFAELAERYPGFDPSRQPPAPLDGFTESRGGTFLVASMDGEPVGCAGLRRLDTDTAELRRVFVRRPARGSGVARALLAAVLETARERDYRRIRLDTGRDLPEARALFLDVGFRDIEDYNGNPLATWWMELVV